MVEYVSKILILLLVNVMVVGMVYIVQNAIHVATAHVIMVEYVLQTVMTFDVSVAKDGLVSHAKRKIDAIQTLVYTVEFV